MILAQLIRMARGYFPHQIDNFQKFADVCHTANIQTLHVRPRERTHVHPAGDVYEWIT
jgi:hypothetical protein